MNKQNELIVFLHNDLDAAGCMLNIEFKYPTVQKKYFFTNYGNLSQIVEEIKSYMLENGNNKILCADVSFSDNPEALRTLTQLGRCTVIDHHMYPEDFWDEFGEVNIVHDSTKSASMICNEYLGNKGINDKLDKLTYLIDIYDIWRDDHPGFFLAQDLNEFFWDYSVEFFTKTIIENDWKLPSEYNDVVESKRQKAQAEIISLQERQLIHRHGEITMIFSDAYFNQIMISEMQNGQNFVIGFSSYGIVRIRINQKCGYSPELLNALRYKLSGIEKYGHLNAFTYKIQSINFDKMIAEAKRIVETITEIFSNKR